MRLGLSDNPDSGTTIVGLRAAAAAMREWEQRREPLESAPKSITSQRLIDGNA